MLDWKVDRERALDIATKTSTPFFWFAPEDFTKELAQIMRSLYLNTISNTSKSAFDESFKNFEDLMENALDRVAAYHYTDIIGYQSRYEDISYKFRIISERLTELEKRSKTQEKQINYLSKKDKKIETLHDNLVPCLRDIRQNSTFIPVETEIQMSSDTSLCLTTQAAITMQVATVLKQSKSSLTVKDLADILKVPVSSARHGISNCPQKIAVHIKSEKLSPSRNGCFKAYSWVENLDEKDKI